jgi:small-conductance mechanosensitive channel
VSELFASSWFAWAVGVALGLPVGLVVLTECHNLLLRRQSFLARPVGLLRNYLLPLGALLLLLIKATEMPATGTSVRVVSTVFGFIVLVMLLSGLDATVFQNAPEGSWRKRMPTIFINVARFVVIGLGVAMIFSIIWGADIGGMLTALGVGSVVIGLTLQNSVGQIISGLLMLFEQPFRLGDWLQTPTARGRVVEVNWRAVHIDTGSGIQVMPNSVLAGASFTNLSRPAGPHNISINTKFSLADPPDQVCAMLNRVAGMLPHRKADVEPVSVAVGAATSGATDYRTTIGLITPADDAAARAKFLRWVWYAARREELHLDKADDVFSTLDRVEKALRVAAPTLRLSHADLRELLPYATVTRYGGDEILQHSGDVPTRMSFVVAGRIRLTATAEDGSAITVGTLDEGSFIGQTTLTRQRLIGDAYAIDEVTLVEIPRQQLEELVQRKPLLLQEIGRAIDERRSEVRRALAAVAD